MVAVTTILHAQTTLYARSPGRSYEQIDSTLGLNSGAMEETPDQCWSHPQFGRHILEVYDSTLKKYVYEFYIHIKSHLDNDRCINFDRQRAEIKTDSSSPSYLKGYVGNKLTYTWMFKLPAKFQEGPNFTHIHQIKAVDGDYSSPIFTLSPFNDSVKQEMQIVYTKDSSASQDVVKQLPLAPFLGTWITATENLTVGAKGTYSIVLKNTITGKTLLTYTNDSIQTIRPSNSFIRPKWGLYRSVIDSAYLRDDTMRLTNVYLFNNEIPVAPAGLSSNAVSSSVINLNWFESQNNLTFFTIERSFDGITWDSVGNVPVGITAYSDSNLIQNTIYYYRVKAENPAGSSYYTNISSTTTPKALPVNLVSFNAGSSGKNIELTWEVENEVNFSKYELECSSDGISFGNLSTIVANGKSTYSYLQTTNIYSKNYYRLKLVNKDGSFSYSNVISVITNEKEQVIIYPNPAKDFITVVSNNISPNSTLIVQDAFGRKVLEKKLTNNTIGTATISTNGLSNGNYFLQLIEGNKIGKTYSFIISR